MSTGLECEHVQYEGKHYYFLQQWDCPAQCWSWREFADSFGPFDSEQEALDHRHANHANPGGYSTYNYDAEGAVAPSETTLRLIAEATVPRSTLAWPIGRY